MFDKKNFTGMFGSESGTTYLIDNVIKLKSAFALKDLNTLEELLGLGDSWSNMACIEKLVELGYIELAVDHESTNYRKYRNLRL